MNIDANILDARPGPKNVDDGTQSLGEFCINRLDKFKNETLLIDINTGIEWTGNQIRGNSIALASSLQKSVSVNDVIAICSENRIEFVTTLFASFAAGITVTTLNSGYTEVEINHALQITKPKIVFASPSTVERVTKVAKQNSFIEKVIVFDDHSTDKSVITLEKFIQNSSFEYDPSQLCKPQSVGKKVAIILYSSGTTGLPKGVEITERNIMYSIAQTFENLPEAAGLNITRFTTLSILPWYHINGLVFIIGLSINNHKSVFLNKFEEKSYLNAIKTYKVNMLHVVPPIMVVLSKSRLVKNYDVSSVQFIRCGAAPMGKELMQAVQQRFHHAIIHQGYGMTECVSILVQTRKYQKLGSVGVLRAGTLGRVVCIESGKSMASYEQGELVFKSDAVMKGYLNDEEATRKTIDSDGWLHTGDIGYYDKDGEFFVVDRLKELIKYNGFQVPPAEIEDILLNHPKVADVAVIGIPDERTGEKALAFVVKHDNVDVLEHELVKYVASLVSVPKRLHGGVIFVTKIPKNPSGKILRKDLKILLQVHKSKL